MLTVAEEEDKKDERLSTNIVLTAQHIQKVPLFQPSPISDTHSPDKTSISFHITRQTFISGYASNVRQLDPTLNKKQYKEEDAGILARVTRLRQQPYRICRSALF